MLTAYEVLKEPVTRILMGGNEDPTAAQNALNGVADGNIKSETPSVKKRHRRMKSSSNKANDLEGKLEDCNRNASIIAHTNFTCVIFLPRF